MAAKILSFAALLGTASAYKVVVLGDVHGDYDTLIAVLRNNGILDSRNEWVDDSNVVVSVGDTIGRGHQDKDVLEFIKEQNTHPTRQWMQGLGNHEIMQLRDDWRYAIDGNNRGFGSLRARQEALARGSELGDWLRGLPAIQQVADNLFVHAGLYNPFNQGRSKEQINEEIWTFLAENQPRFVYDDLIWDRDLAYDAYEGKDGVCEFVAETVKFHGADNLFFGHTPVQSLWSNAPRPVLPLDWCDGHLYDVDVGISRWMYSNPVNLRLEVVNGETVRVETIITAALSESLVNTTALRFEDSDERKHQ